MRSLTQWRTPSPSSKKNFKKHSFITKTSQTEDFIRWLILIQSWFWKRNKTEVAKRFYSRQKLNKKFATTNTCQKIFE